jgi:hypothetical protein
VARLGHAGRVRDPDGEDEIKQHRDERRAAFEALAAAQRRAEQAESAEARKLIADFVQRAHEQGIEPVSLRGRASSGRTTFRTPLKGWYLQRSGPLAVSTDGEFYVLIAQPGLLARFRDVDIPAREPPLAVGRGARDGESMPLKDLLDSRLAAGRDFPNQR